MKHMTIKLDTQNIRNIATFEKLTKVHVKDSISDESCLYFLVEPGKAGAAIGKNGSVIKQVNRVFGKPVKVYEFADEPEVMIRNLIPSAKSIESDGETVTVSVPNQDRSVVIGRSGRNIKVVKEFLSRHFKIKNLRLK